MAVGWFGDGGFGNWLGSLFGGGASAPIGTDYGFDEFGVGGYDAGTLSNVGLPDRFISDPMLGPDAGPFAPDVAGTAYSPGLNFSQAMAALNALAGFGSNTAALVNALQRPPSQGADTMTRAYPMEFATGFAESNPTTNPALRAKRRFPGGRQDLQAQMGSATISPQLAELMLGEEEEENSKPLGVS